MIASIPLSAFRVPEGKLALTFDLNGSRCLTAVVDAADVERLVQVLEVELDLSSARRKHIPTHLRLRNELSQLLREDDAGTRSAWVALGLWLALNNPLGADHMRGAIARSLRTIGRAQLTITGDARQTWGFALSERLADLAACMAALPEGAGLVFSEKPTQAEPAFN